MINERCLDRLELMLLIPKTLCSKFYPQTGHPDRRLPQSPREIADKTPEIWGRQLLNHLTPNDPYMGRTAPLTSKRCILYIYSTNIGTEYFKNAPYSPLFFSSKCSLFHNANLFGSCIIHILYTGCAKIKKIIPAPKG